MRHGMSPGSPTRDRAATGLRRTAQLIPEVALELLGTVSLGRVVFAHHALPAVRPVSHVIDTGNIVFRLYDAGDIAAFTVPDGCHGVVVAYEADSIDRETDLGWSVVVTGYAVPVTDGRDSQRYAEQLRPSVGGTMGSIMSIRPGLITGFRVERI